MNTDATTTMNFATRLQGRFSGLLQWSQLDELWSRIKHHEQPWFFYQLGEPAPIQPLTGDALATSIDSLDALLHQEHSYDYCGIVYVDNPREPTLVKVYDPNNLGSSCSCGGGIFLPRWVLSIMPPETIEDEAPIPKNRRRWWGWLSNTVKDAH